MQQLSFEEVLARLVEQDPRFHREAYLFLREALDHTQAALSRSKKSEPQHVTGQELLDGLRRYALAQYGPMSKAVLNEWGVLRCEDFGELVFNMVDRGLLSKTEQDRREDFKGGYDFDEAFLKPFRPTSAHAQVSSPTSKANPT